MTAIVKDEQAFGKCKMETKILKIKEAQNTKDYTYRTGNHIRQ